MLSLLLFVLGFVLGALSLASGSCCASAGNYPNNGGNMKDQHTKIKGYRDLSQSEIDAMNSVKALEADAAELFKQLQALPGIDQRDMALARTHFEDACIRVVRAVARPVSPWG